MQQLLSKSRKLLFMAILLLALVLYYALAMKVFHSINLVFIALVALSALLIMVSGSPFRIFLILVLSIPLSAIMAIDIGFTIVPAYILLLLLIFIMVVSREFWYSKSTLDFAIIAFLGVCALSIVQTIRIPPPRLEFAGTMRYRGVWFRSIIQLLLVSFFSIAYFFTVHFCGNDRKRLDILLKAHIVMAVLIAVYGIYQAFAVHFDLPLKDFTTALRTSGEGYGSLWTDVEFGRYRSQATFSEPLGFGNYLLSALPLLLAFGSITKSYIDLRERKWMPGGTLALVVTLFFVALFMTRSRGPLISLALSMLLMMVLLGKKNLPVFIGYVIISMSILAVYYSMTTRYMGVSSDVMQVLRFGDISKVLRMEEISQALSFGVDSDASDSALRDLISGQRFLFNFYLVPKLLSQHPILGVGIGNFPLHASVILRTRIMISPVGLWANILAETGFLGFSVFCWMMFTYYRTMIRTLAKVRGTYWAPYIVGVLACVTGFMVHYLSWGARMDMFTWFFIGISMAIVKLVDQDLNQNANDRELNTGERTTDVIRS
jgi:O-antigen ligase